MSPTIVPIRDDRAGHYSDAQRRTIDATTELFACHGVKGTSFSMIAARLGVTKAAIYHQFKTKDALVLAVAEVGLTALEDALETANQEEVPSKRRLILLERVIDLAVARRSWINALQGDPIMIRLFATHPPFMDLMTRVYTILLGLDGNGPTERMRTALVSAAIGGAVVHPLVADLDDNTLKTELLTVTRQLFDLDHQD